MASYLIIALIYLLLTLITTLILKLSERKMDGKKFSIPFFHYRAKKEASV
jgi:ABC-type arginine transport system permease subunit